jgi:methionyl aminopeptidase
MINAGTRFVTTDPGGWTVRTKDGKLCAHFEHTIAITDNGPIILTDPD